MNCCEAGLKPAEFFDISFEETTYILQGYRKRNHVLLNHTRMIMYSIVCTVTKPEDRTELYDMFYIPGDPTPEQRQQQRVQELEELKKLNEQLADEVRKENAKNKQ